MSGSFSFDGLSCKLWTTCTNGQEQTSAGTSSTDRVCKFCASGQFSNAQTNYVCTPQTAVCSPGTFESTTPSVSVDRVCSQCSIGTFNDVSDQTACRPCDGFTEYQDIRGQASCKSVAACPDGKGEFAPPTSTSNRVCTNCQLGVTFGVEGNTEACKQVSDCPVGTEQTAAPTLSADRVCSPCPPYTFNAVGGSVRSR